MQALTMSSSGTCRTNSSPRATDWASRPTSPERTEAAAAVREHLPHNLFLSLSSCSFSCPLAFFAHSTLTVWGVHNLGSLQIGTSRHSVLVMPMGEPCVQSTHLGTLALVDCIFFLSPEHDHSPHHSTPPRFSCQVLPRRRRVLFQSGQLWQDSCRSRHVQEATVAGV
jgi:hypothetical protein